MRAVLVVALAACALHAQAQHPDPDKLALATAGEARFQLRLAPLAPPITTPDGRYRLQSGLDPEPRPTPSNHRFALHSQLHDKSSLLTCSESADGIFADRFE